MVETSLHNPESILFFTGASLFGKNDTSKALKKGGGLGGRKALNDISNSAKPSSLQASKKNSASVISIGKDLNATKNKFIAGTKDNLAKVPDKGGRKALTDLTNSSKPSAKQGSKKGLDKKLSAAAATNIPMIYLCSYLHRASKFSMKSMGSRIPVTSSIICLIHIQLKRGPNQQKLFK
uniref:Putative ovule protein n=1 Tax=Solanum chacoense TaxID=4108 RepID=A0A0V0IFW2_SOLCH